MHKSPDPTLPWDDVRYFLALTRTGSLSAAARLLAVEHSTVARRVESLERALGLRLFDRLPRGWQLTGEGEELLGLAERMEEHAFAFERAAVGAGKLHGIVRLSAPPGLSSAFLVPRIAALREQWPEITLEVIGETREVSLARREADLALRLGRPAEPELVIRSLGEVGMGLYARQDYAARNEAQWEFVGFEDSLRHVPYQQWLEHYAGTRHFALRSNDASAVYGAVRAGLGIGCLPHYQASREAELILLDTPEKPPARDVWLVLHADVRRSPRVRLIANLVTEIFECDAAFLAGVAQRNSSRV